MTPGDVAAVVMGGMLVGGILTNDGVWDRASVGLFILSLASILAAVGVEVKS